MSTGISKLKPFNIFMLAVAGCVKAYGMAMFFFPLGIIDSGFSGFAELLAWRVFRRVELPLMLVILNVPICIICMKLQGLLFSFYSFFAICIYGLVVHLFLYVINISSFSTEIAANEFLLCVIFGGLSSGIGRGIALLFDGAVDGADMLAVYLSMRTRISLTVIVAAFNVIMYFICDISFNRRTASLYAFVAFCVSSKTVGYIMRNIRRTKQMMITTTKADEVIRAVKEKNEMGRSIISEVKSISSVDDGHVYEFQVSVCTNYFNVEKNKKLVYEIDPSAIIWVLDVDYDSR